MAKKKLKKKKLSPQKELKLQKKNSSTAPAKLLNGKSLLFVLAVLLITTVAFIPSLDNAFVNWDDDRNFYENELITTINDKTFWSNSVAIFKTHVIGNYNPLTIFSFAIDQKLFGLDQPFYWHFTNLILHLVCTFFVFLIGRGLGLGMFGAVVLSLLFGIHPMRVESVAWVTERKDVLFGAFYLAALYYYIKGKRDGFTALKWAIISICFGLSLLAKIQAVFLPVSMVLVDYLMSKESQITIKSILTKIPFFIGSIIIGLVNIYFLNQQGSIDSQTYHGFERVFIGSYSLVVYYIKSLVPFRLSPLYPYPSSMGWEFYASILSFILTAGLLIWAYIKKWKVVFFGLAFFMANIFMLLQILGAGQGFLADRFTYIAYIGLFFIYVWYTEQWLLKKPQLKTVAYGASAFLLLVYGVMTFNQNKIWKDSNTLWTHVLKYYKNSTLPWGNRANYNRDTGNIKGALRDYAEVIRLKPDNDEAYNSRARLYFNFDDKESLLKALENYTKAIELNPTNVEFIVNKGATYAKLGDLQNALTTLNQAEKTDPSFANIYLNRSVINNQMGNYDMALIDIDRYLAIKPNYPDMWYEKARLHNGKSQGQQGLTAINKAIGMNPNKGLYYFERAKSQFMMRQLPAAKQDLNTAQQKGFKGDPAVINTIMNAGQ